MQNEKKYCIRLRFIEPHPRVIVRAYTSHTNVDLQRDPLKRALVKCTRRLLGDILHWSSHTSFFRVEDYNETFTRLWFPSRIVRGPEVETFDESISFFGSIFLFHDVYLVRKDSRYFNPLKMHYYYCCYYYIILFYHDTYTRDEIIYKNFHNEKRGCLTS